MIRFFRVRSRQEVVEEFEKFSPVGQEQVQLWGALGRVLYGGIVAQEDLPHFPRATMDGFAVKAKDTFGASDGQPALLRLVGEVPMGLAPEKAIGDSDTMRVATGSMLPEGADAVVMIEHAEQLDSETLEVYRTVAPWENVVRPGEDVAVGQEVLPSGWTLRPQDLGLLGALGMTQLSVFRKPTVAVFSTGDEVVPISSKPGPAQVRDVNGITVCSWVEIHGGIAHYMGIIPDRPEKLSRSFVEALEKADAVMVSGGSSVGTRDFLMEVLEGLEGVEVMAHGLAVRPGKPTLVAGVGGKPFLGLPGHPVSALVILHLLGRPLLDRLCGRRYPFRPRPFRARLSRNLASAQGREDYVRVTLEERQGELWAVPLLGSSGLIGNLSRAEGLVRIDPLSEGLYKGEWVEVESFP
ncbi:MAG: gephyrin-like molybdotransferase Glp [bacterium]